MTSSIPESRPGCGSVCIPREAPMLLQRRFRTALSIMLAALVVAAPGSGGLAQTSAQPLVLLTITSGTVLLCEDLGDESNSIKVINLRTGEPEQYQKHKLFERKGAEDPAGL